MCSVDCHFALPLLPPSSLFLCELPQTRRLLDLAYRWLSASWCRHVCPNVGPLRSNVELPPGICISASSSIIHRPIFFVFMSAASSPLPLQSRVPLGLHYILASSHSYGCVLPSPPSFFQVACRLQFAFSGFAAAVPLIILFVPK